MNDIILKIMAVDRALENRLIGLLKENKFIEAIKLYRENTNMPLKESKDFVEQLMARQGIVMAPRGPKLIFRLLLVVLIFSLVAGIVCVALAGLYWPVLYNVSTPFVCPGVLRVTQEVAPNWAGVQPFIYCVDSSGNKSDVSMAAFAVSAVIYSLITFVIVMILAIVKGKKTLDAREKGLSA